MRKKQWMTSMIALSLTMGSMGMVFAADSAAPTDVKTISYGPIISITGSAAEQAHWIHSGWKQTVDVPAGENVVGNIVAYGNGNVYTINAPDSDFGVSKGEQQATFKIAIDTSKMNKNNFYSHPEQYGITGQVLQGNLVIKAPIVAKAEMGGKMVLTGKDMHYNLLYSHLNQYLEDASKDENIKSTIEIHLTGDLIPGDNRNKIGSGQSDWLRQAGANNKPNPPGGEYYVGDIITNQDGSDGGEKGVIKVWANNIATRNVYAHEESDIELYAKNRVSANKVWNVDDSNIVVVAPHIQLAELETSGGNAHSIIGDKDTKDVNIDRLKLFGGDSSISVNADTVNITAGKFTESNIINPDVLSIDAKDINWKNGMMFDGVTGQLNGSNSINLSGGKYEFSEKDNITINTDTFTGKMDHIYFKESSDEHKLKDNQLESTVTIHAKKGSMDTGALRMRQGQFGFNADGLDTITTKFIELDTTSEKGNQYADVVNLSAKNINIDQQTYKDKVREPGAPMFKSIVVGDYATANLMASESINLAGDLSNDGTVKVSAPTVNLFRASAGSPKGFGWLSKQPITTEIEAENLNVKTALSAAFPESTLKIKVKNLTVSQDGKYDSDDSLRRLRDAGTIWADRGGTIDLSIADKGKLNAVVTDNNNYIDEYDLEEAGEIAEYDYYIKDATKLAEKIAAIKTGKVDVNLGNEATWTVLKDSHVTNVTLQPKASIDLTGSDAPVSLVTNTLDSKDGIVDIGYTKNNHSMLTVTDSATGNVEVRVIPKTAEDLAVNVPKTQVVAVTNPKEGFKIKTVPYFEKGKIAGYTIPVTQEEGNGFIGGTFVKETNAMNPEAALNTYLGEQRRAMVDHALLSTLPEEAYMPGVWASIGHGHYAGPYTGTHKDISVGYTKEVSPQWLVGGRILHENGDVDGDVDSVLGNQAFTSKQRWTAGQVYGRYQQGNAYVKGDILVGNFKAGWDNDAIGKADASAQALHLEAGKAFKQGNWTVTPLVRLTLGRTPGYTAALSNGFTTRTDAGTLHFLQGGVRVEGQVSPSVSWNGRVLYGSGNRGAVNGVVTDGTDSIPWSVSGAGSLWDMSVGMTYQPRSTTTWGVSLGKMTGSGVREGWNWQVKGGFHF